LWTGLIYLTRHELGTAAGDLAFHRLHELCATRDSRWVGCYDIANIVAILHLAQQSQESWSLLVQPRGGVNVDFVDFDS
jgi:hypothetical protein